MEVNLLGLRIVKYVDIAELLLYWFREYSDDF